VPLGGCCQRRARNTRACQQLFGCIGGRSGRVVVIRRVGPPVGVWRHIVWVGGGVGHVGRGAGLGAGTRRGRLAQSRAWRVRRSDVGNPILR